MKNRIPVTIAAVLLVLSVGAIAQEIPRYELAGGYSYMNVNPNISQITSQNFNGGGGAAVFNLTPLLGIKADFMGYTYLHVRSTDHEAFGQVPVLRRGPVRCRSLEWLRLDFALHLRQRSDELQLVQWQRQQ